MLYTPLHCRLHLWISGIFCGFIITLLSDSQVDGKENGSGKVSRAQFKLVQLDLSNTIFKVPEAPLSVGCFLSVSMEIEIVA